MYDEKNTGTNLPGRDRDRRGRRRRVQASSSWPRAAARRTRAYLFQETKALLNPARLMRWLDEKLRTLGTAACPPYHLALVIGGTSAEYALKIAKLASARYLDTLPDRRATSSGAASATSSSSSRCSSSPRQFGIGAQFGGKYFCHDVRVDPPAAPRRVVPGRDRGVVLGRPPGARQDHRRRRVPRAARDRSRAVPARGHRRRSRRRGRAHRPQPADGEIRATLSQLPGEDARDADRPDGRRPRHRARQDQGAARRRRADARSTCATTASTTPVRPRRPRATRRARSVRRPPAAWTPTSTCSRRTAAAS